MALLPTSAKGRLAGYWVGTLQPGPTSCFYFHFRGCELTPHGCGQVLFYQPRLYYFLFLRSGIPSPAAVSTLPSCIMPSPCASLYQLPGPCRPLFLQLLIGGCYSHLLGVTPLPQLWAFTRYFPLQGCDHLSRLVTREMCGNCGS